MKYSEVYNKAAGLVERGWTQHASARDRYGDRCQVNSTLAVSWCFTGALNLAGWYIPFSSLREIRDYVYYNQDMVDWNDNPNRTKKDVVKLLRDAAKRADEEGKTCG